MALNMREKHRIQRGKLIIMAKHHYNQFLLIHWPGSAFIKPDQLDPWIKDQIGNTLLSTILHLQLPNFVSCGRADSWSLDQADLVW